MPPSAVHVHEMRPGWKIIRPSFNSIPVIATAVQRERASPLVLGFRCDSASLLVKTELGMSVSYTLKESVAGFKRNRSSTLISIFTVSISLLLLGIFTLITVNLSSVVSDIRSRVEVEVFLSEDLSAQQQKQTGNSLQRIQGVDAVKYTSKADAARNFQKEVGENPFDILDFNPLPASYRLTIATGYNNVDSIAVIEARARKIKGVDDVVYRKQFLTLIDKRSRAFRYSTLVIGIILSLSAVILVANTIRLTIYAKREIIRTMKLVGATPMFIRLPFFLEGLLHGLIGGIIASILIEFVFTMFIRPLSEDLLIGFDAGFGFYLFLIILGCTLGMIGSAVSIGRFLRETIIAQA